jgi:hypothetical protein
MWFKVFILYVVINYACLRFGFVFKAAGANKAISAAVLLVLERARYQNYHDCK